MLYNFDWLQSGKLFPPLAEIPRLKGYKDNADLFEDNIALVLKPYYDRLGEIVSGLKEKNYVNNSFFNIVPNSNEPHYLLPMSLSDETIDEMKMEIEPIKKQNKQMKIQNTYQ